MFRMVGVDLLFEPRKEAITVLGERAQQTPPVALPGTFDRGSPAARKPCGMRLNLHGFLGLVDANYGGVHLPPLFLISS